MNIIVEGICFHVDLLIKKASKKYHALVRVSNYMDLNKRRSSYEYFYKIPVLILSVGRMFHSRTLNNKINRFHEKALRHVYRNKTRLSFEDLLSSNKQASPSVVNFRDFCRKPPFLLGSPL